MRRALWFVTFAGLSCAAGAPAFAQQPPLQPQSKGIYVAFAGGQILQPTRAAALGVEYGERVGRRALAYASLSYFENLMDSGFDDDLERLSSRLTATTGRSWSLHGSDRGVGFVVGAKAIPATGRTRPYIGGGAGAIAIRRRISDRIGGDVTAATLSEFGIGDSAITNDQITRPLAEAAFGVNFEIGRTHVDVGYRYRRVFQFEGTPNFSQITAGIGINF
jgi:hypothetical protein